jgi:hypothetical protein
MIDKEESRMDQSFSYVNDKTRTDKHDILCHGIASKCRRKVLETMVVFSLRFLPFCRARHLINIICIHECMYVWTYIRMQAHAHAWQHSECCEYCSRRCPLSKLSVSPTPRECPRPTPSTHVLPRCALYSLEDLSRTSSPSGTPAGGTRGRCLGCCH